MGLSVDDIVAKFPTKTIPTISGEPDYASINNMVQLMYGNAASLPTTLGGGQHGHVGLIMTPILYATLSDTDILQPAGRAADREHQWHAHKENHRIYKNHQNMDDALNAQVIDTINDTYLNKLRNKYMGYLGVSTRELFDHLLDRYGKITPADIADCKCRINESLDSTQPINVYFQTIDECIQYAADGQVAFFTPNQILQTAYHTISTSGYYNDACKEWRKKQANEKTWPLFKRFFAAEYHDLKEQQKINTSQNNFHGANATTDITDALEHLAFAATTNWDIVTQLTASVQQLTAAHKQLTEQIQQVLRTKENWSKNSKSTHPSVIHQKLARIQEVANHLYMPTGLQNLIWTGTVGLMATEYCQGTTATIARANSPTISTPPLAPIKKAAPQKESIPDS
jgi:uncharacterized protein (DUF433 family)